MTAIVYKHLLRHQRHKIREQVFRLQLGSRRQRKANANRMLCSSLLLLEEAGRSNELFNLLSREPRAVTICAISSDGCLTRDAFVGNTDYLKSFSSRIWLKP